jgi:acyl carrier protein
MTDRAGRLATCFTTVFPKLAPDRIPSADTSSVPDWDSLHHITLLTVVGEEFDTELPLENLEELASYQGILKYLEQLPA